MYKFPIGRVIRFDDSYHEVERRRHVFGPRAEVWGHIVGFAINNVGETILEIKRDDGQTVKVHPANICTEK